VVPGTRVDVLLTGKPVGSLNPADHHRPRKRGRNCDRAKTGKNTAGEPQLTPVITLLVSPDDAQKLTLATTEGKIQLSLRNPLDTKQQELPSVGTERCTKVLPLRRR